MTYRFALIASLTLTGPSLAIDGDGVVEAQDHPEAVLVNVIGPKPDTLTRGSGVLIAPRVVLTAAHGVMGDVRATVTAPYVKDGSASSSRVTSIRIFPGYSEEHPNRDLAVLILADPLAKAEDLPGIYGGPMMPIDAELLVIGRVRRGQVSNEKLFAASVTLIPFPRRLDLYGGHPQRVQPGDSGGPVYLKAQQTKVIGLISRYTGQSRRFVATDGYVPIGRANRSWIMKQFPR